MKLLVEIELGNDAMETLQDVLLALAGSFAWSDRSLVGPLVAGDGRGILDRNGNTVGSWRVEEAAG